jgi:hypothetical protein
MSEYKLQYFKYKNKYLKMKKELSIYINGGGISLPTQEDDKLTVQKKYIYLKLLENWTNKEWKDVPEILKNIVISKLVGSINNLYKNTIQENGLIQSEIESLKNIYLNIFKSYELKIPVESDHAFLPEQLGDFIKTVAIRMEPSTQQPQKTNPIILKVIGALFNIYTVDNNRNLNPSVLVICGLNGINKLEMLNLRGSDIKHINEEYIRAAITNEFFYDLYSLRPTIETYSILKKNIFNVVDKINAIWINLITYTLIKNNQDIICTAVENIEYTLQTINKLIEQKIKEGNNSIEKTDYEKKIKLYKLNDPKDIDYAEFAVGEKLQNELIEGQDTFNTLATTSENKSVYTKIIKAINIEANYNIDLQDVVNKYGNIKSIDTVMNDVLQNEDYDNWKREIFTLKYDNEWKIIEDISDSEEIPKEILREVVV